MKNENRSKAISTSWSNEETKAKRSRRMNIIVGPKEGNGSKAFFRSLREAFVALDLPLKAHIALRQELAAKGTAEFGAYRFEATKFD